VARRLKRIESLLDHLVASRRIDQFARLERIYTSAKELVTAPMDRYAYWELWRLRGELRELRAVWRQELAYKLERIEDPNEAGWFKRMFTRQRSQDTRIHGEITEGECQVAHMEVAMRLEHVFAVLGGTIDGFLQTLRGELVEIEKVRDLLQQKADLISEKSPELCVPSTANAMTMVVNTYRELLTDLLEVNAGMKHLPDSDQPLALPESTTPTILSDGEHQWQ
jgi:hypothetical protein